MNNVPRETYYPEKPQSTDFDVIVAGGGHAGIEASLAAARMGSKVLLVTMDRGAIGRMSCNPAIGGTAKGQLVREIDALGGEMGRLADATGIQFRMLNTSKGPAVWSPRCQSDRDLYSRRAQEVVLGHRGITLLEDTIDDIQTSSDEGKTRVTGVVTTLGREITCRAFVLCAGTFMRGIMHTGLEQKEGGRFGELPSRGLTRNLETRGFFSGRLKTGTPPRVRLESIDLDQTEEQGSDIPPRPFSFETEQISNPLVSMYLTWTNPRTHEILRTGFDRSPMFSGRIKGTGPRYCPSIEDKISRFADKDRHQIYLEPEGYDTSTVYVNGFSTSLPADIQLEGLRSIPGLGRVEMIRPGYAVEYDYFPPYQIKPTFETKKIRGLFFAGQICGTSGYEEAAAQGLVAGINAALLAGGDPADFELKRSEAYIGVLADDLATKSTEEPYRMFTSRAEYRLLLRQDNADLRLTKRGHKLGLVSERAIKRLEGKERGIASLRSALREKIVRPTEINSYLESVGSESLREPERAIHLLRRPGVTLEGLLKTAPIRQDDRVSAALSLNTGRAGQEVLEQVEIGTKFEGYIERQNQMIERMDGFEEQKIPGDLDFHSVPSLSSEGKEKLSRLRPTSIGQASRISGITPSDVSVLLIYHKN